MSNLNPLIPQGSLLEQNAKGKPHLRVAYIIVAIHLFFLGALLIQGCKREDQTARTDQTSTNDAGLSPLASDSLYNTNFGATLTNPPGQDLVQTSTPALPTLLPPQNVTLPTPPPVELPALANREYVVLRGDTYYSIGKKFGVSTKAISRANPGLDPARLKIGEKLQIPASSGTTTAMPASLETGMQSYVVKSGDTLGKIARAHGTTVTEIRSLNGLKTDRINVGYKLKLPAARSGPAVAPTTPNPTGTTPLQPLPGPTGNP